jgi:hypothetical protein
MQQNRANPLLSRLGCAAAIVMVLVLGIVLRYVGGGPFSPGPLAAASPRQEPLSGFASHAEFEADCAKCHAPWHGSAADRCESCHTDIADQRLARAGMHGRLPDATECDYCHTEHKGREAIITTYDLQAFEHDLLTEFSLVKHQVDYDERLILCDGCHPQRTYEIAQITCQACHASADAVFMEDHAALYGERCQYCHDGHDSMIGFDHQAVFPLDGGHADQACQACHTSTVMSGTPSDCSGCHEEPAVHLGQFGLDCARCHTALAWLPARLSIHTFPLDHGVDHGQEGNNDCQSCHVQRYDEYTCTNCHAHEPAEIRALHVAADILEFETCTECHPTGVVDEFDDEDTA